MTGLSDGVESAKEELDPMYRHAGNDAQAVAAAVTFAGLRIAQALETKLERIAVAIETRP